MTEVPKDMATYIEGCIEVIHESKAALVVNGPADLPATFEWHVGDEVLHVPLQAMVDGLGDHPLSILGGLLPSMRATMGPAQGVVLLLEGVGPREVEEGEMERHVRGEYVERWRRGDPTIREHVMFIVADRRVMALTLMPFHYGDGAVVWEELHTDAVTTASAHARGDNVSMVLSLAFGEPGAETN